jgi:hypothetical protein
MNVNLRRHKLLTLIAKAVCAGGTFVNIEGWSFSGSSPNRECTCNCFESIESISIYKCFRALVYASRSIRLETSAEMTSIVLGITLDGYSHSRKVGATMTRWCRSRYTASNASVSLSKVPQTGILGTNIVRFWSLERSLSVTNKHIASAKIDSMYNGTY